MKYILYLLGYYVGPNDSNKPHSFEHLNNLYKDQLLHFDEYGNPVYLIDETISMNLKKTKKA